MHTTVQETTLKTNHNNNNNTVESTLMTTTPFMSKIPNQRKSYLPQPVQQQSSRQASVSPIRYIYIMISFRSSYCPSPFLTVNYGKERWGTERNGREW